jgi:ABC-2 type transport system permease protein
MLAVVVTCFAITVVSHAGSDEHDGRTEQVLATGTSRSTAFLATVLVSLLGSTWLLLVTGGALAVGYGAAGGVQLGQVLPAALAQAPAVWVVAALAAGCFAVRGEGTRVAWALLVLFLTAGELGELFQLPPWVIGVSPYTHVPAMPAETFSAAAALALTACAAALVAASWQRYRVRDIAS